MVGERLKKFRKQQGSSQEEFADRLCISQSWCCNLEKQSIGFTTDVLYRICKELKIDITQLLNANMEITPPPQRNRMGLKINTVRRRSKI